MATNNQRKKPGPKPGTKRTQATKKKTTATRSQNSNVQEQINPEVKTEIILIAVFALCILLFLCNFHLIGVVGEVISGVMFGLMGLLAYVFPLALFFLIAFTFINKNNPVAIRKIIFSVVLFIFVGIICQLFVVDSMHTLNTIFESGDGGVVIKLYESSKESRYGGGVLFGGIAFLLYHYIGMVGTIIIALVVCVISILFLSQKTILKAIKEHSSKAIEQAKVDKEKRREIALSKQEEYEQLQLEEMSRELDEMSREAEEQLMRRDKKVSGVMLDTKIEKELPKEDVSNNDIHEINLCDHEPVEETVLTGTNTSRIAPVSNQLPMEEISIRGAISDEMSNPSFMEQEIKEIDPIPLSETTIQSKPRRKTENTDFRERALEKQKTQKMESTNSEESIDLGEEIKGNEMLQSKPYAFPPINLLTKPKNSKGTQTAKQLKDTAYQLQQTLENFGVNVTITDISHGPVVTRYELQPEQGVKVSKIVGLADDIKLNLAATDIRIEAPIPGKAAIGIEVPNKENSAVDLRELIEASSFEKAESKLTVAVGKDIGGTSVLFDIGKMPHVLIAGATGSGKSVCINTIIMSILYKAHPDDVKLIMIDPKVVELNIYNGIPHLLVPVVTDPKKASAALHWGVTEMTERYKLFADMNVRDLKGYNKKVEAMKNKADAPKKMPQIVIIVDELADLMMVAPGEVEESICRLAQLARAAGIHLILATQRPSVNVITGLIKANMPSRIAFSVSSGVDSRTILDMNGAEKLLGKGDMLFYPQGYSKPVRVQGAFVSDKDVSSVVDFLKNQAIGNVYSTKIDEQISSINQQGSPATSGAADKSRDIYFEEAGRFILEKERASIGMLQRVFKIGFNRAARIMDQLCDIGLVGPEEGTKPRKVLMTVEEFETVLETINNENN